MNLQENKQAQDITLKFITSLHGQLAEAFRERDNKKINILACRLDLHERMLAKLQEQEKTLNKTNTTNV